MVVPEVRGVFQVTVSLIFPGSESVAPNSFIEMCTPVGWAGGGVGVGEGAEVTIGDGWAEAVAIGLASPPVVAEDCVVSRPVEAGLDAVGRESLAPHPARTKTTQPIAIKVLPRTNRTCDISSPPS
jgi:hypothetical protein